MNRFRWALGFVTLFGLGVGRPFVGAGGADPFPMSAGYAPQPLKDVSVGIEREDLQIDITFTTMNVRAHLELRNHRTTPAVLEIGFPCTRKRSDDVVGLHCQTKPQVTIQGRPTAVTLRHSKAGASHWTWPMRLLGQGSSQVDIRYQAPIHNERYSTPLFGALALSYQLTTGARWAGPIGTLNMDVTVPVETIVSISPAGYTRTAGHIHWSLQNYEPTEELAIWLHPIDTMRYVSLHRAKTHAELQQAKQNHTYDLESLKKLAAQWKTPSNRWDGIFELIPKIGARYGLSPPSAADLRRVCSESAALIAP